MNAQAAETAVVVTESAQHFVNSENIVYLMGLSFVLGSFFTILVLILLDFMKRHRVPQEPN